ncbi:MAG: phosphoribosylanthranilate isomerase [Candidatus Cyclobacteriaceae bacterium M3_2C_046]
MFNLKVKICCISSVNEAMTAIRFGAAAIGLVGKMPSGPGVIEDDLIAEIARAVPPPVATFLLTSETQAENIIAHYKKVYTSAIQLVDTIDQNQYQQIKKALPQVKLIQVVHVVDQEAVKEAITIAPYVDAILLDSGNPKLAVKELGGTGRVHNWDISRKIRETVSVPVFLAGGLNLINVKQAIETVEPFGIDLCSSVRTEGRLDRNKLEAFFNVLDN